MIRLSCTIALTGAAFLLAAPATALGQTPAPKNECFFVNQFQNWKAGGDEKTMIIRVAGNRFYRLDLANACHELSSPFATLINKFRSTSICSPLDWDMQVSQGLGPGNIPMPCMVKAMTRLSPAEVAALPKKQKP
jgi:hypothetical protein